MREHAPALLLALVVLVLGWFGYERWFGSDHGAELILLDVGGDVTVQRPGEGPLKAETGFEVQPQDGVKVGEGGHAVLTIGAETRLTLNELSSIQVLAVSADGVRVELEEGKVSARVRPGSPSLSVLSQGRDLSASDADFEVVAEADGGLTAQASAGAVTVTGVPGATTLSGGHRLVSLPGQPAALTEVTPDLLLQVEWPGQDPVKVEEVSIKGKTGPYARLDVKVGSQTVATRADASGAFEVQVPVAEGDNPLTVQATDMMGEKNSASGAVKRDSRAPTATSASVLWDR